MVCNSSRTRARRMEPPPTACVPANSDGLQHSVSIRARISARSVTEARSSPTTRPSPNALLPSVSTVSGRSTCMTSRAGRRGSTRFRLSSFSASFPLLDAWNESRRAVAARYVEELEGVGDLKLPGTAPGAEPAWHLFVVQTESPEDAVAFPRGSRRAVGSSLPGCRAPDAGLPLAGLTLPVTFPWQSAGRRKACRCPSSREWSLQEIDARRRRGTRVLRPRCLIARRTTPRFD